MEARELLSPTVAIPVFCVLFCAFFVFAIGFKSPAQPPSFDVFDEESKKKRAKKSKSPKSNGHAVVGAEGDAQSAKPQPSPRQAAKPTVKAQATTQQKSKPSPKPQEPSKKTKKQTAKEVEQNKEKTPKPEVVDDVDGWHTVSVSKKDKKQKKKEPERQEEEGKLTEVKVTENKVTEVKVIENKVTEVKVEEIPAPVAQVTSEQTPASPQEQRNKKKKDKKNKKLKTDTETIEPAEAMVKEEPVTTKPIPPPVNQEPSRVEEQIKEAMETVDEEFQEAKRKTKGKKKSPSPPLEDYVIPQIEPDVVLTPVQEPVPSIAQTDSPTTKTPKKKQKKDKKKHVETVDESKSPVVIDATVDNTNESKASPIVPEPASPAAPTFDELGGSTDSWEEAKPKNKKKKARRAD